MQAQILRKKATHLLKLEAGEPLLESIIAYAAEHHITAGRVSAIRALAVARLGFFDRQTKTYDSIKRKPICFSNGMNFALCASLVLI